MWRPFCFPENCQEGAVVWISTGPLFSRIPIPCAGNATNAKVWGRFSRRHMMPLNLILVVDLFDVWGINFMRPFPSSLGYLYILVGVDYVSKWVEAVPCRAADHRGY